MADFDPARLLAVLAAHGVEYVLIGGFAAALHGSPFPTLDVDITPEASAENLDRLSAALAELDARIRTEAADEGLAFDHSGESLRAGRIWNLTTRYGDLDIALEPSGTQGFPDLARDAVVVTVHGTPARLASLADVVRSKQAANRPKDQRVLPTLREILAQAGEA